MIRRAHFGVLALARPRSLLIVLAVYALLVSTSTQTLAWTSASGEVEKMQTSQEASSASEAPAPSYGSLIASTALSYVGYPYVYAGAGPYGFDCSGFTQYIVGITTGIWISHAVEAQPYSAGTWVDYGSWLPGDLIFFQNTYRAGISHVGIYIGDGQIVHAENESTGVTIDSIYSSYYGPRYWGAVRIA